MHGPSRKGEFHSAELASGCAKSPRSSVVAFAAAVICAGIALVWLSWSFFGQVANGPPVDPGPRRRYRFRA